MWKQETTANEVDTDDAEFAPDLYAHKYVKMKAGDIAFIEVLQEPIILWRVECMWTAAGIGFLTEPRTYADAEAELLRRKTS